MYSIIRENEFDKQASELAVNYDRMHDLDSAIDWALSINPDKIPNTVQVSPDFWLWVTDEFYNIQIPMVRILYKIDSVSNTVVLLSIEEATKEEEPAFLKMQ